MLRWLLLAGLLFGLGTGFSKGWIELRWGRLLVDLGVPYVADPGPAAPACPLSSAKQARKPSR
ncbi:MAG: hypothetical protein FJ078_08640 [Cyanobacteria bacterium K_DeepCast_35m_m2_155]|nr:hypothetical protein [Cyanobacteria bacterium K_DeepCast_35m_m2_155]